MSVLAYVRDQNVGSLDYEGQVFGYAFELMESAKDQVGLPNPMSYCVDEDALVSDDEIDEMLDNQDEDDDEDELEDAMYTGRGEYFERDDVLASLRAYKNHFESNPGARAGKATGEQLALDLGAMIEAVEGASGKVRIYLS